MYAIRSYYGDSKQYDSWWGFPTLPNVNELEPSYTAYIAGEQSVLTHWASYNFV